LLASDGFVDHSETLKYPGGTVPAEDLPRDADLGKLNSSLNEGIENCRSVVANYRNLLKGDKGKDDETEDTPKTDAD